MRNWRLNRHTHLDKVHQSKLYVLLLLVVLMMLLLVILLQLLLYNTNGEMHGFVLL